MFLATVCGALFAGPSGQHKCRRRNETFPPHYQPLVATTDQARPATSLPGYQISSSEVNFPVEQRGRVAGIYIT